MVSELSLELSAKLTTGVVTDVLMASLLSWELPVAVFLSALLLCLPPFELSLELVTEPVTSESATGLPVPSLLTQVLSEMVFMSHSTLKSMLLQELLWESITSGVVTDVQLPFLLTGEASVHVLVFSVQVICVLLSELLLELSSR